MTTSLLINLWLVLGGLEELKQADGVLGLCIFTWITYHCAYRKRGTRWLALLMLILPIYVLTNILGAVQVVINGDFHPAFAVLISIHLCAQVAFWIACIRLRKLNRTFSLH